MVNTMEYIKNTDISPFISKGMCKVCYVGQDPNRNHTVITKELATEMGRKLPGSPVVGYFNKDKEDFEGHNRELIVTEGKFEIADATRPYGFVPTNANVWFQKFDDEGIEHEYLCTDVYIWTKTYPESKRIFDKGNNHSMELANDKGFWTNDDKTNARIFIYNEALIEKLCILGEEVEPCFEGAQFASNFSLENNPEFQEFKNSMFSMMQEIQETLSKGGSKEPMDKDTNLETFQKEDLEKDKSKENTSEDTSKKEEDTPKEEPKKDEKKKYNLEEIPEYTELKTQFEDLQSKYSALEQDKNTLETEVKSLREFKLNTDRKNKQAMIDSFYMLSDEDKKDVVEHIDTYSLEDIEGKLSIICVRNKVNFNLDDNNKEDDPKGLFSLNNNEEDNAPAWIKAIRATAKSSI